MENKYESLFRTGSLGLSIMAFAGLTLLAALLWNVASGYVLLLLIPALAISFYQLILTPIYGLRMDHSRWTVMADGGDRVVPLPEIAHLRVDATGHDAKATLVLRSGDEIVIPVDNTDDGHLELIRAATERGIPVRSR